MARPNRVPVPRRYEHAAAGDLIQLGVKQLGCIVRVGHRITGDRRDSVDGAGWEAVFVAVDDHSRLAHARLAAREDSKAAVAFLFACVRFYKAHGVTVRRLLTDNGSAVRSKRFRKACRRLGLKHRLTKPYTPRTNGKAEVHSIEFAGMGVCTRLRSLWGTCCYMAALVTSLQLASPPPRHRRCSARLPPGARCEQPLATPQLARVYWNGSAHWLKL
jgi:hypothetical protein